MHPYSPDPSSLQTSGNLGGGWFWSWECIERNQQQFSSSAFSARRVPDWVKRSRALVHPSHTTMQRPRPTLCPANMVSNYLKVYIGLVLQQRGWNKRALFQSSTFVGEPSQPKRVFRALLGNLVGLTIPGKAGTYLNGQREVWNEAFHSDLRCPSGGQLGAS